MPSFKKSLIVEQFQGNYLDVHVNEISFLYEKMGTKTRFEKEAKGNSEMVY